ncbi:MAG TPA: hypothetical protein VK969_02435 [Acidimicrobiia bacterium]|nr:hypothetical protein [Acidimicrobiia bacterium]
MPSIEQSVEDFGQALQGGGGHDVVAEDDRAGGGLLDQTTDDLVDIRSFVVLGIDRPEHGLVAELVYGPSGQGGVTVPHGGGSDAGDSPMIPETTSSVFSNSSTMLRVRWVVKNRWLQVWLPISWPSSKARRRVSG